MFAFVIAINLLISWLNARACGYSWREMSKSGLWSRLVIWSALIQSAIGFTLAYYILVVFITIAAGKAPPAFVHYTNDILVIGMAAPVLGSGLVLTVNSWKNFLAERSIVNGGVAAWNTVAQVRNSVELGNAFFSSVTDLLTPKSKDDQQGRLLLLAFMLVTLAAMLGVLTTYQVFNYYRTRDAGQQATLA